MCLQVCRVNPGEKGKYIKIILALLQSVSTAVVYECAVTLVSLSQAPTAIRAAANCYCQLLVSHSDNNVKLIVLDRLQVCPNCFLSGVNQPAQHYVCMSRQMCPSTFCLACLYSLDIVWTYLPCWLHSGMLPLDLQAHHGIE